MDGEVEITGKDLKDTRFVLELSQEEMAQVLSIGSSTLRLLEQGKKPLSPRLWAKIKNRLQHIRNSSVNTQSYQATLERLRPNLAEALSVYSAITEAGTEGTHDSPDHTLYASVTCLASLDGQVIEEYQSRIMIDTALMRKLEEEAKLKHTTVSLLLDAIIKYYFQSKDLFAASDEKMPKVLCDMPSSDRRQKDDKCEQPADEKEDRNTTDNMKF
jgi:DNA-binding XRE family transcriptional regulator